LDIEAEAKLSRAVDVRAESDIPKGSDSDGMEGGDGDQRPVTLDVGHEKK